MAGAKTITINLTADEAWALNYLSRESETVRNWTHEQIVGYLLSSITDGLRRPGSWEAQLIPPLFGIESRGLS